MLSTTEIQEIAELFFNETPKQRANNCNRMAVIMESELEDRNISCTRQEASISHNGTRVGHAYITIPESELEDVSQGPVIVDVAIHQFNQENVQDPNVNVQLNLETDFTLPTTPSIGIYKPSDPIYSIYTKV